MGNDAIPEIAFLRQLSAGLPNGFRIFLHNFGQGTPFLQTSRRR
jgi:hypothetical protein